jgi:hypothetical protein
MSGKQVLAVVLLLVGAAGLPATELVPVRGSNSNTQFTTTMDWTVNGKPLRLLLTGVALRQKIIVNVYALASYVQEGVQVRSPEELAAADVPKQLHLVMERTVGGRDLAEAFVVAIRGNHPSPAFDDEVAMLTEKLRNDTAYKGDHIYLTHLPGTGLEVKVAGRTEFVIKNPQFYRAVWDIYLGRNNLGEGIKRGLVSRLP